MRTDDIVIQHTYAHMRTESLYFPKKKALSAMPLVEARRGLCPRSGGDSQVCRSDCPSRCRIGKCVIALEESERLASKCVAAKGLR